MEIQEQVKVTGLTSQSGNVEIMELHLPVESQSASIARAFVRRQASEAGFDPIAVQDIEVAVGEAMTNAILHGSPHGSLLNPTPGAPLAEVVVSVEKAGGRFTVTIRDSGPGFDSPTADASTLDDLLAERGRGLALMGLLMDHLDLHRVPGGMVVRMERRLPGSPSALA